MKDDKLSAESADTKKASLESYLQMSYGDIATKYSLQEIEKEADQKKRKDAHVRIRRHDRGRGIIRFSLWIKGEGGFTVNPDNTIALSSIGGFVELRYRLLELLLVFCVISALYPFRQTQYHGMRDFMWVFGGIQLYFLGVEKSLWLCNAYESPLIKEWCGYPRIRCIIWPTIRLLGFICLIIVSHHFISHLSPIEFFLWLNLEVFSIIGLTFLAQKELNFQRRLWMVSYHRVTFADSGSEPN